MCISILIDITIAITNVTNIIIAARTIAITRINFLCIKTNPLLKFIYNPRLDAL